VIPVWLAETWDYRLDFLQNHISKSKRSMFKPRLPCPRSHFLPLSSNFSLLLPLLFTSQKVNSSTIPPQPLSPVDFPASSISLCCFSFTQLVHKHVTNHHVENTGNAPPCLSFTSYLHFEPPPTWLHLSFLAPNIAWTGMSMEQVLGLHRLHIVFNGQSTPYYGSHII